MDQSEMTSSSTVDSVGSQKSEWSDLPKDLLGLICLRIRYTADLIRIGAVCSKWHTVIKTLSHNRLCPILLLYNGNCTDFCDIFDFSKNKIQQTQLYPPGRRELRSGRFTNTCNGWLVRMEEDSPDSWWSIHVINPFTRVSIQLPPASTFRLSPPWEWFSVDHKLKWKFLRKIVLSSTPLDPKCVFVAIYDFCYYADVRLKLALCGPQDTAWKTVKSDVNDYFVDVIYFKGRFYALGRSKELFCCDIDGQDEPKAVHVSGPEPEPDLVALLGPDPLHSKLQPQSDPEWVVLEPYGRNSRSYLVDWCGDLLMVVRYTVFDEYNVCRTKTFKLFKFDFGRGRWEEIDTLGGGGEGGSIFVGHSAVAVLSIKEDLHEFKPNSIYFLEDNYGKGCFNLRDAGVFCLSTKVCKIWRMLSGIWPPPFLWISPDLCTSSE